MKKTKSLFALLCISAMLLSFSGCTPATTQSVLKKMIGNIAERTPTAATVTMDLALTAQIGSISEEISVCIKSSTQLDENNSYSEGEFTLGIGEQKTSDSTQVYQLEENGKLVTFTHTDSTDRWTRAESALLNPLESTPTPTSQPDASASPEITIPEELSFLLLEEETQTINDTEVYVLTGNVDGEDLANLIRSNTYLSALSAKLQLGAAPGTDLSAFDLAALDYTPLTVNAIVYVDKASYDLVQIDLDIEGLNTLITEVSAMLPENVSALLGKGLTARALTAQITDVSFEPVTLPALPEEGRILGTQSVFNPDLGDGSYALMQGTDAVKLTAQNGWIPTEMGNHYVSFKNAAATQSAAFQLYKDLSAEQFIQQVEANMTSALEAQGLTVTSGESEAIGDYKTYTISSRGINIYLAYRSVGDTMLGICVQDSNDTDLITTMTPILSTIEDYQVQF